MAFGVYVHIPYCLQICPYCDFTKYELGKIMPPAAYVERLLQEIRQRSPDVPERRLQTIYFGGGTPSLLEPSHILAVLTELANAGFERANDIEISIEIDPATVDQSRLETYLAMGINRFSVGAQTFNERLLKIAGRKHTASDTVRLLSVLKQNNVNYSFDLLFALPTQTLEELRLDVATALTFAPSHLSAYCLTVPENHPMARGRAPDEEQVRMFELIEFELASGGLIRYEVSNFARPGFESRHNLLYWTDQSYWGLGVSAHSYFPGKGVWGTRLQNSNSLPLYERGVAAASTSWTFAGGLPIGDREELEKHQSLSDFCHTSLRLMRGLDCGTLRLKFGDATSAFVISLCEQLMHEGLLEKTALGFCLSPRGKVLADRVFERLTFLAAELTSPRPTS